MGFVLVEGLLAGILNVYKDSMEILFFENSLLIVVTNTIVIVLDQSFPCFVFDLRGLTLSVRLAVFCISFLWNSPG